MTALQKKIFDLLSQTPKAKSPEAEARLIFHHTQDEREALEIVRERMTGVPLQHILGEQYFYDHEYLVNEQVLIPRPETEILIHLAIQLMKEKFGDAPFRFAELGLGSGILSAEILSHFPNAQGIASEASSRAIEVAKINLEEVLGTQWHQRLEIMAVESIHTGFEIFKDFAPFDLIISNPPYVSSQDEIETEVLLHEPRAALFPPWVNSVENPNFFYENFLLHGHSLLKEGALALFEIPHERSEHLIKLFQDNAFQDSHLLPDLTGRARVLWSNMMNKDTSNVWLKTDSGLK